MGKVEDILKTVRRYAEAGKISAEEILRRFPELKESEDERIRKSLIEYFESLEREEWFGIEVEKILAYLEKMKRFSNLEPGLFIYNESGILSKPFDEATTNGIPGKDYVPVDWVETLERYGKWKIVKVDEQKPTEWSAEDEKMLEKTKMRLRIAQGLSKQENDPDYPSSLIEIEYCISWLDNRLKSLRPQPKQEWTEEDKNMLEWLCCIVHSKRVDKVISLKEESELGKWMDKWLNHSPQPHWKPTEEQVKVLGEFALPYGTAHEKIVLNCLYNDLKKLM